MIFMVTYIIIMVLFIFMSAYFSATETAFSSLNKTRIKALAEKGNRRAILTNKLSENYDKLLSSILIGNNMVNIAMASLGTALFVRFYGEIGTTISTIVITVIVLIFGEITPKSIAKDYPERFAMFSAPFLNVLLYILTPLNFLFSLWKKLLNKIVQPNKDSKMSQEELLLLVDEVQQDGSIDQDEGELLRNAIEFTEREAQDIITHRVDLEGVDLDAPKTEISQVFTDSKYSRILVYDKTIDHVLGVIHMKDFYTAHGITDCSVKDIITPVIFVPRSEKISIILQELQKAKSHVAVVLDEFGGTFGIVTMEDILEELVGEIFDEHDEENQSFVKIEDNRFHVDAMVDMDTFCKEFDVDIKTESLSLAGWLTEMLHKIPDCGDSVTYENMKLTVIAVDGHRVDKVELYLMPAEDSETDEYTENFVRQPAFFSETRQGRGKSVDDDLYAAAKKNIKRK